MFTPQFVNTDSLTNTDYEISSKKGILLNDKSNEDAPDYFETRAKSLLNIEQDLNSILKENDQNMEIKEFKRAFFPEDEQEDRRTNRIRKQKPPQSVTVLPLSHFNNKTGKKLIYIISFEIKFRTNSE